MATIYRAQNRDRNEKALNLKTKAWIAIITREGIRLSCHHQMLEITRLAHET